MKKINILLILALVAFGATSCSDIIETEPKSAFEIPPTYSNAALTELTIMGINTSFAEEQSYRGRFLPYYGMNTDCEWYNSSQTAGDKSDLANYNTKAGNTEMNSEKNAWAKMYEGIERANLAIAGIRQYGNPQPRTEMGHLLAEALTLRAVFYADLTRAWGDVPARFEPLNNDILYVAKSDRDVIYKQIIADLGEAAELAFWPNEHRYTTTVNRVNKAFIKALRARICLVAAGYSQRPDSQAPRRSTDPELTVDKMYKLAETELLDVYSNPKAGKMSDSFEQIFRNLCLDKRTVGGESLWEIPFSEGRGRMAYTFAVKHQSVDQYTDMAQGGSVGPTPNFFYDYDVNDLRRDVTCVPYRWSNAKEAVQEFNALNNWCFGKYRFEWMKDRKAAGNDDGLHKQYMRYSEVVLMLAEVTNHLHGHNAAKPYLKEVRFRAFPENMRAAKVDAYVDAIGSKEAMLNAIVDEHAFEFAGEMLRKEALIRWNKLGEKMADTKVRMNELRSQTLRYADVPTDVYGRYKADNETLEIYGLNRGETTPQSADNYPIKVAGWVGTGKLNDAKIESLYKNDPDKYQFWPIWTYFINNSNSMLKNDYGY